MNATTSSQMLLAFWRQRDQGAQWGRLVLYSLFLASLVITLWFIPQARPLVISVALALVVSAIWFAIIASLLMQNHPHSARFVPGHVRQLREAALLAWALASLGCAGLLWLALPRVFSLAVLLLGVSALFVLLAWVARNWVLWLPLSFGPPLFFGLGLDKRLAPLGRALQGLWSEQTLPVLALCLLALGWSVTRLFGDGDAAHRDDYACQERMRRAARESAGGKHAEPGVWGRPFEWLGRPLERAYAAWLRHVIATAVPAAGSVMRRAEIVLHGRQHWLYQLLGSLLGIGIAVLSFTTAFAVFGVGLQENWKHGAYGIAIGLASMGFNPCFTLPNMLWHSRHEQVLLRLLPGMPQGEALNRSVAWLQLRHALVSWAVTTGALALLAWAAHDMALLCLAFVAIPLCATYLLRAPARMKPPSAWTMALPIVAFILGGWGLYAVHQKLGVPLAALGGLSLAVSLALVLWRWRALSRAPLALPAGRLG